MSSLLGLLKRNYTALYPPVAAKAPDALRWGILGAAGIAPAALILPAKSHPEVIVTAVAARDKARAEAFAKKHGIPKSYSGPTGYQELLNDPDIDAIYNPLPNGLHYEWTLKALAAGKHVLLEKPSTNTAEETRKLYEYAQQKGLVLLEAFHYRFHPAIQRVKEILDSGELGEIKSLSASLSLPKQGRFVREGDIRYIYDIGGGIMMDMGCYTMSVVRYLAGADPVAVTSASADTDPRDPRIDFGTSAALAFPADVSADIECHACAPGWGPAGLLPRAFGVHVEVRTAGGTVTLANYVMPNLWHTISVAPRGGPARKEKAYVFKEGKGKGEAWWFTYRYQLEAFVDKVKGREPQAWMSAEDSIANMEWVEKVYQKANLGSRPMSNFVLAT